jgi:kynurenine formamidase
MSDAPEFESLLRETPRNWGRWGPDDEVGALNLLTADSVLRGLQSVRTGEVFTLGAPMAGERGEPITPERTPALRVNTRDRSSYTAGRYEPLPGGLQWADDVVTMYLQGTTHIDAVGHAWYGDQIWNGYSADETIHHLSRASILPIAERGIVGRAVLIDIARYRGRDHLQRGEAFTLDDVLAAAERQGTEIQKGDILLLRTGWVGAFYNDREAFLEQPYYEPGMLYEPRIPEWFHKLDIPVFGTDTLANELQPQPTTGLMSLLHATLMRNLGVIFNEILRLGELAEACAGDGQWSFLYVAAPIKVVGGTGAPVNPVAIR